MRVLILIMEGTWQATVAAAAALLPAECRDRAPSRGGKRGGGSHRRRARHALLGRSRRPSHAELHTISE